MLKYLATATCLFFAATTAQAQSVPVDDNFLTLDIPWDRSGRIALSVGVRSNGEDQLVLCGAFASIGGQKFNRLNRQLLAKSRLVAGSEVLLRDLKFFHQVTNAYISRGMIGAETKCVNTGKAIDTIDFSQFAFDIYEGPYRDR